MAKPFIEEAEAVALEGLKAMRAYLAYQGQNKDYLLKAKVGSVAVASYTRHYASITNREMLRMAAQPYDNQGITKWRLVSRSARASVLGITRTKNASAKCSSCEAVNGTPRIEKRPARKPVPIGVTHGRGPAAMPTCVSGGPN